MPAKKKSNPERDRKRRVVAKGMVKGRSTRAIAESAGVSERQVQRLAKEPETRFLIEQMFKPHRKRLERLAEKAIAAVSVALAAKRTDKADHMARLRAIGRYKQLCEMAEGRKPEESERPDQLVTWEEFVVLYRRRNGEFAGAVAEEHA